MSAEFEADKLNSFKKTQLVELVLQMQREKNDLKAQALGDPDRITELERSHYLYQQYGRRNTIEITGIPAEVEQNQLENEVIKIFNEANVEVHGNKLTNMDIEACHRIGKKNVVITRFVNRKFAYEALYNGKNLKGTKLYGNNPVYINNSFCREFNHIGFLIRKLKRQSAIYRYKVRHGVFSIKIGENDNFVEITHKYDFEKFNLGIEL